MRQRLVRVIAFTLAMLAAVPALSRAGGLRAGAAKATITPDVKAGKVYLAGFGNNRVATGVHDDLYVRCLALAAGRETVALCSVDLIGLFYDDVLKIRQIVKEQAPEVTHVIVAATHTHAGPDTLGLWGPSPRETGTNEKYLDWLAERVAQTATQSVRALEDARLTLARDDHPLLGLLQNDSRPPYVRDPYLFAMRLASPRTGKPIATLINWSDHPETLGRQNTEITADYAHWLCGYVEQQLGGTAVFFNGAIGGLLTTLGNQVLLQDRVTGEVVKDGTWKKAELFGTTLGGLGVRAIQAGESLEVESLLARKAVLFAPVANDRFRVAAAQGVFRNRKNFYTHGKLDTSIVRKDLPGYGVIPYAAGRDVQTEVNYLALLRKGKVVAEIASIPGEIYPELINGGIVRHLGADFPDAAFEPLLRPHFRSKYQFVFGLANDELGYIIPKAEWDAQPPWLMNRPDRWYGEVNSAGPEVAGAVMEALVGLITQK